MNDGFVILTSTDSESDKIFNNITDKQLLDNDFTPQIPSELRANRSVVLFKVDNHIFDNTEDDIKKEIEEKNDWVGEVIQVYKFSKGNVMKVTFNETKKAKKALEIGMKMFSMKIPHYDIKQDIHHNILTCLRCYTLEDHTTAQCDLDKTHKVCSECSSLNHTWRECDSTMKRCLSCNGPHSTMAMRCPKRKEILNMKRREDKKKEATSYTDVLKKNSKNQAQAMPSPPEMQTIPMTTKVTIYQAMMHSHYVNVSKPGSYSVTFNNLMKAHNLPTLNIQEDPPSLDIITKIAAEESMKTSTSTAANVQAENMDTGACEPVLLQQQPPEQQQTEQQETSLVPSEKQAQEQAVKPKHQKHTDRRQRKSLSRITGTDIGLKIYTTRNKGWVEVPLRKNSLLKGIEDKIIKWTYTEPKIKEKEIMEKFVFGQIDLTDCFFLTEEDTFRKIKTGLLEERSPPPRPEKQRKEST